MISVTEIKRTVEVKEKEADVVYEEHTTRTYRAFGLTLFTRKLDYVCTPFEEKPKKKGVGY